MGSQSGKSDTVRNLVQKVAEVNCVAWKLTPEPGSLKAALFDCGLESS